MLVPRTEQYNPAITWGHYKGRFTKEAPLSKEEEEILLKRKYEKELNAKRQSCIDVDIVERIQDTTFLKVVVAKRLSNPTIEIYANKIVVISVDDDKRITIKTKNPEKVLEDILH